MRRNDKEVKNKRIFRLYRRYMEIERELEIIFPVHFCAFPKWYTFHKDIDDIESFLKLRDEAIRIKHIIYNKEYKRFVKYVNGGNTYSFTPMKKKERKKSLRRQFGIRLEQRELIGVLNTIPLNSLRFVVEETICTKCSDEVHQEIVDRPVSGVYKVSFVL